ncbi:MAG: sigma-70 family RNA polymerase sigma factor [Hamadaea sp.]|uniref:RNA polymerase sigma factor n=1 Tax=Hamadaea sp. TaxID=2024425 RepID=UPI0017CD8CE1|nr:sigma-70 family RNA polymerase sigma factor [Hamadaea sp.]NUR70091.1 sigma-70 family RNA polymerase sigma factor [Hamadaea sp.]NUT23417.1 sigma-70 family RNA polymerase sigma factor [Hamadaea sp.]
MDESMLVTALSRGDREALSSAYRRYAGRLRAYAWRLLGDTGGADAVVQSTFDLVGWHADELRDPHRLRAWLYAIVRHECRRRLRGRDADEARPPEADGVDPTAATRSAYAVDLVRAAMTTLTAAEHEVAELSVRHGLAAAELGAVLSVSPGRAYDRATEARTRLEEALDALTVMVDGRCRVVRTLPGRPGKLSRKRLRRAVEHAAACGACRTVRRELPSASTLLSRYASLPFVNASTWLTVRSAPDSQPRWSRRTGFPRPPVSRTRRVLVAVASVGVAVALAGGALKYAGEPSSQVSARETPSPVTSPTPEATITAGPTSTPTTSAAPSTSGSPVTRSPVVRALPPVVVNATVTVQTAASATCGDKSRFVLAVTATAGADLAAATLTWQAGDTRTAVMTVDVRTAYAEVWSAKPRSPITWWVSVTSRDGRTASTPAVTTGHPCV